MKQQIENQIKELNLEGEISLEDVKEIILNEKDGIKDEVKIRSAILNIRHTRLAKNLGFSIIATV